MSRDEGTASWSWPLLTDLYELTMAFGYWQQRLSERRAVFHLSYRKNPFGGRFAVACGLGDVCHMLDAYRFDDSDLAYLASLRGADSKPLFPPAFLDYLEKLRFGCDVDAIEEGTVVQANTPMLRVEGPLLQAQILESALLNCINFQTLVATKAARICSAARGRPVLEFGLRRAQGVNGALAASRAAYIGGCAATSNVLAGKMLGIPVRGTHAHSWIMCFADELSAFTAYAQAQPGNCIFLVDTYDTKTGVRHAIAAAKELAAQGHRAIGIRLDSGDLATLSREARQLLDQAGLSEMKIVASNDLDEHEIAALWERGAAIDIFGVGTRLVTAYDQPALAGVYKLAALQDEHGNWDYKMKLSEQAAKVSTPGILQVRRLLRAGRPIGDIVYDRAIGMTTPAAIFPGGRQAITLDAVDEQHDLLVPVYRAGRRVYDLPALGTLRERTIGQLEQFRDWVENRESAPQYPVGYEPGLWQRQQSLQQALKASARR